MSRISNDEIVTGMVKNGFDYDLQVWVKNYIIQPCGHPLIMRPAHRGACCTAWALQGKDIRAIKDKRKDDRP